MAPRGPLFGSSTRTQRLLLLAASAALATGSLVGCMGKKPAPAASNPPVNAPAPTAQPPSRPAPDAMDAAVTPGSPSDPAPPEPTSAQFLARRAEAHARAVDEMIASRGSTPGRRGSPSGVEWMEPDQFSLSPFGDAPAPKSSETARRTLNDSRVPTDAGRGVNDARVAADRGNRGVNDARLSPDAGARGVNDARLGTTDGRARVEQAVNRHPDEPAPTRLAQNNPANAAAPGAGRANQPIDLSGTQVAMSPSPQQSQPVVTDAGPIRGGTGASTANPAPSRDNMEQQLRQRTEDYPRDVAAHLDYQTFLFLKDEPVPNLAAMAQLPAEDRELITAYMDGLTNFRNALRADSNMLLSRKVRPLIEMSDRLRARADLGISSLRLCKRVEGFGVYDPIDPVRFTAGRQAEFIVYAEVENFASQLNTAQPGQQQWETKLSQDLALYSENGMEVWRSKNEVFTDLSRNRRRDFFVVKRVSLPDNLVVGRYLLKATIVDQQSNRVAESSVPVQFVAQ
jgi:hypothetical protein